MQLPPRCRPGSIHSAIYLVLIMTAMSSLVVIPATAQTSKRLRVEPFPLQQVRLLDSPFRAAMERNRLYLRGLELDRLLHTFRLNAGLPTQAQPLGGWEAPEVELRGHFIGHFLSACALMYAAADDDVLKAKGDSCVTELAKCQKALGEGYLSAYPESLIDRVETGKRVWAPYYTLHKIMAGLLDMHLLAGNREALDVLVKFAGWVKRRTDKLDDAAMQRMLRVEFGGISEVMRNLYATTGNPEHLRLARRFDHTAILDPLSQSRDALKGLHVNTQIPKIIGTAREFELTGDIRSRHIAEFFWDEVVRARSYPTGGTSYEEHWGTEPFRLATHLGQYDHETCCTYNMLKLTHHLFTWDPYVRYADYLERALLNGIMPVQHPETGMTMYYVPMGSGWYKTFGAPRESFWCCTGTGVEQFATLGQSVYFHDEQTLYVNLFIPSKVTWPEKGMTVFQETEFPEQQGTSLVIELEKPVECTVAIRIPGWTRPGGGATVNGKRLGSFADPGSYYTITRRWSNGDRIVLDLPMRLQLSRLPDNSNRAAILFGPVVLAGELGNEGITTERVYGQYGPDGDPVRAPFFVANEPEQLNSWIKPVDGKPLTFRTVGAGNPTDVTLIPFYRLFDQRYALHWDVYSRTEWEALVRESQRRPAGVFDSVAVGDSKSEDEHNFQGFQLRRGEEGGRKWIACGDWLKIDFDVPLTGQSRLLCAFLASDTGKAFRVFVDGTNVTPAPGSSEDSSRLKRISYPIPAGVTAGKKRVGVTLRVDRGEASQRLFGAAIVKEGG